MIKAAERVGASEATLLNMLDISPFTYGLVIQMVYDDGTVFEPHVLDMTQADLRARFLTVCANTSYFLVFLIRFFPLWSANSTYVNMAHNAQNSTKK